MQQTTRGFTLIELLVVVAIIAIIAAIALPNYRDYVIETTRSEGKAALMDAASRQEQFYLDNKTYTTTVGSGGLNMPMTTENGNYQISVEAPTAGCPINTCYVMSATPQGGQTDDTDCATLQIESDGTKTATGSNPSQCW